MSEGELQWVVVLVVDGEHYQLSHDETRDIEMHVFPVRDTAGHIGGRLVVLRDVSEEKSVERFRWEATNMIVHDLRAPLGAVISSLRLVQEMVETGDFADLDQVVSIALNSSEHQLQMIESILEIAKLETGRMPLDIQTGQRFLHLIHVIGRPFCWRKF